MSSGQRGRARSISRDAMRGSKRREERLPVTEAALKPLPDSTIRFGRGALGGAAPFDRLVLDEPRLVPESQDWWSENGPGLRWWCPAAGCSACAACELPCWPAGRAGSDWTHERVPQKPNQNALQFLLPENPLPGWYYLAPPVQTGSKTGAGLPPKDLLPLFRRTNCASSSKNLDAIARARKQVCADSAR